LSRTTVQPAADGPHRPGTPGLQPAQRTTAERLPAAAVRRADSKAPAPITISPHDAGRPDRPTLKASTGRTGEARTEPWWTEEGICDQEPNQADRRWARKLSWCENYRVRKLIQQPERTRTSPGECSGAISRVSAGALLDGCRRPPGRQSTRVMVGNRSSMPRQAAPDQDGDRRKVTARSQHDRGGQAGR